MKEHKNNRCCRRHKHTKAAGPQQVYRCSAAPQLANNIATNHRADAQGQASNGAQGGKQKRCKANATEPIRQISGQIQGKCINGIDFGMMHMHEHTNHHNGHRFLFVAPKPHVSVSYQKYGNLNHANHHSAHNDRCLLSSLFHHPPSVDEFRTLVAPYHICCFQTHQT